MPPIISPKVSFLVLGVATLLLGALCIHAEGLRGVFNGLFLLLVSPFATLAVASQVARRNVIVRFSVVLGLIFLAIDAVSMYSVLISESSTAAIGLGVVALLQLLLAAPLLIASGITARGSTDASDRIV
jgi:hypothetical protein